MITKKSYKADNRPLKMIDDFLNINEFHIGNV